LTVGYSAKGYQFSWSTTAGATHYELFEDPDGAGPLAEAPIGGAIATQHYAHVLAPQLLLQRLFASYRLRACNAGGCSSFAAAVVPDVSRAIGYVKASVSGWGGRHGWSVALSADGSTLAVGAPGDVTAGMTGTPVDPGGAIEVYVRGSGGWVHQARLKAAHTSQLGYSLSISADGGMLVAGAPTESSGATGINGNQADRSAEYSGAVYAFTRSGSTWTQQAYIKASNTRAGDVFGSAVALSADGTTLGVGAPGESSGSAGIGGDQNNRSAPQAGAVYLFARSGSAWLQQTYVKASNAQAGDQFGVSLAFSSDGSTLVVGAEAEDGGATGVNGSTADDSASDAGAVYVLTRSNTAWSQQAYIKASNAQAGARFGQRVALSADGSTLVVGAPAEGGGATGINGNQASNTAEFAGAVYAFTRNGSTWLQQAYIKASNTQAGDGFGHGLALSADGLTLAVGATGEDGGGAGMQGDQTSNSASNAGAVYLIKREGSNWTQRAYLKASNTMDNTTAVAPGSNSNFGYGLALSADGGALAVGAPYEPSKATGIGGDQADRSATAAGAVYLY
jgi:hypothetical protein